MSKLADFTRWARTFSGAVMILGAVTAVAIASGPLVREAVARRTWKEIPCYLNPEATRYHFEVNGRRFISARMNFWQVRAANAVPATGEKPLPEYNAVCYVDGKMPPMAVLRLDAYQNLDQGAGFFTAAVLILLATGFLAISSKVMGRKHPAATPSVRP